MSTDPREAQSDRQQVISDAVGRHVQAAIEANFPSVALALVAEEDVDAVVGSLVDRLAAEGLTVLSREKVAAYLLRHIGGDDTQPWQAGHNYAMTEAARLVREGYDLL